MGIEGKLIYKWGITENKKENIFYKNRPLVESYKIISVYLDGWQ
jgi:hypothetical protein